MADPSVESILTAEVERTRALLRRYLSPRVADAVLQESSEVHDIGESSDVSVLFCDLRGFTRIAETAAPVVVARRLNEFLDEMTQVIFRYQGMLDKYTGDGLLAVFGVPYPDPYHVQRAVHAAIEMEARHARILERWSEDGWGGLALGIGVDSGEVIAGTFGSAQRADYTVIGHAVNVAARLTAKAPPGQILLSERTRKRVEALVETVPLGEIELKNVSTPIRVFGLLGLKAGSAAVCSICGHRVDPSAHTCAVCSSPLTLLDVPADRDGLRTVFAVGSTRTSRGRPAPHISLPSPVPTRARTSVWRFPPRSAGRRSPTRSSSASIRRYRAATPPFMPRVGPSCWPIWTARTAHT